MCGSRVPMKEFMGQMKACGERIEKEKNTGDWNHNFLGFLITD